MAIKSAIALILLALLVSAEAKKPHILFIVADDYGYNDIGYHGSELKTPTLDKLAAEGIKLENYYVQPICSPTRSQLMSGRYQIHKGLQHNVIKPCVPTGLPLEDKTLADKLKESGYHTHIVGKWHLGFYKEAFTPLRRGFDSFFGYLLGAEDYYTHYRSDSGFYALDLHDGDKPYNGSYGDYSTPLFTQRAQSIIENHNASEPLFLYLPYQSVHGPLQVPDKYRNQFSYIKNKARRTYAGMVAAMDEGIRNITDTLKSSGLWEDTLIIFTNDNGGQVFSGGNNAPLRGNKASYFEGGVRGVGFVTGPVMKEYSGTVNHQMVHVSDWFPTLVNLVGGSLKDSAVDGHDLWQSIVANKTSPREEIIYNIDPRKTYGKTVSKVFDTSVQAALRYKDYKIITGFPGFSGWVPEPTSKFYNDSFTYYQAAVEPESLKNVYLFNIVKDPEERLDLSDTRPDVVKMMLERLAMWNSTAVPVNYPPEDKNCNPARRGGVWGPWM